MPLVGTLKPMVCKTALPESGLADGAFSLAGARAALDGDVGPYRPPPGPPQFRYLAFLEVPLEVRHVTDVAVDPG